MKRKIALATGLLSLSIGTYLFVQGSGTHSSNSEVSSQINSSAERNFTAFGTTHHESPPHSETSLGSDFSERAQEILMMPMEGAREEAIRNLALDWATVDSIAAERWAMTLDVPEERERALNHICTQSALADPLRAIQIVQTHELHEGLIQAAANLWAEKDADAANTWADTLPDGELKNRVHLQLLLVRADSEPASAAAGLVTLYPPGTMREEATIAVLHRWLRQDADDARTWVSTFDEGKLKDRAMGEIQGMIAIHPPSQND